MLHFKLSLLFVLSTAPSWADTFSVWSSSENGPSCSKTGPNPVSCSTSSSSPNYRGGGSVTASAGYFPGRIADARIELLAVCHQTNDCVSQVGTASAVVDLAVRGQPAGTRGLIEIYGVAIENSGTARTSITGLSYYSSFGPHYGTLYSFVYEEPFRLTATVSAGCSECEGGGYGYFGYSGYSPLVTQAGFHAPL